MLKHKMLLRKIYSFALVELSYLSYSLLFALLSLYYIYPLSYNVCQSNVYYYRIFLLYSYKFP